MIPQMRHKYPLINKLPTILAHRASEGSLFKNNDFNGRVPLPASESVYTLEPAQTNKQGKACMLRSKNPCRQAKECILRSLRRQTNKGKRVCFVVRTEASSERVYTSEPALTNKQGKVCMPRSKSLCRRTNRGSVYNTL